MPEPGDTELASLIVEPLERDGTFLDGGCGDGALMEAVWRAAARRGLRIEPYGVEADAAAADLARGRLPGWEDRIWTAGLADWTPPQRFDTVRVGLEQGGEELVTRALEELVAPGGRLLLGPYDEDAESYATVELVRGWGVLVGRMIEVAHPEPPAEARRLLVLPAPPPRATVTSLDERRRRRSV